MNHFTEANYENAIIELFQQDLGYTYIHGSTVERNLRNPLYRNDLQESLPRLNPDLPQSALDDALYQLENFERSGLVSENIRFMDFLQNGVPVRFLVGDEQRSDLVRLVDFDNPENNRFVVANQWTVVEQSERRPDLLIYLNGLPVGFAELKSPSREETDISEAYNQLQHYLKEIPVLFRYNAICVLSDMSFSKFGTITTPINRFAEWKTTDGSYENTQFASYDTFFTGIFEKSRFLDILKNFICFSNEGVKQFKIMAGYHQYFAVKKAVETSRKATETDGKGGVFWHTQGSGKSLSMVFYAQLLQKALSSPTIVVITDRNDLDDQLFLQFSKCKDFLRQEPKQANSRSDLKQKLDGITANGIFFTTMQKFEESAEPLSERRNIVVMADEAHRGQYGLNERVTEKGEIKTGIARIIRNSLPNATFIGFTGTPISSKDRSTKEVFGDYIDIYDMTQAVEDGATRPVYYESRVIKLKLDEDTIALLDEQYELMADNLDADVIDKSKRELGKMEAVLGAEQTIDSLVADILDHYENNRAQVLTGKAMIVAYSRTVAMKIYQKLLELRPDWTDKVGVVMTRGNKDPDEWGKIIGNKRTKDEMALKFKDNDSPLKIAIVVDMWLTGFDVPSLATMYVYKPMAGHNLMQAIARVNRVFGDKAGGLVVDYIGIARALKQAMHDFTPRDKTRFGDPDIAKLALPKFLSTLEVCQDLLHGYDYSGFFGDSDRERANAIKGAANFILEKNVADNSLPDDQKTAYIYKKQGLILTQTLSLCSSLVEKDMRLEAAFFETVRTLVVRFTNEGSDGGISLPGLNQRINDLLAASVKNEGVLNLFDDNQTELSLFDEKFLEELAKMKEKNLALTLLKKLIAEQIAVYRRTNVVKSDKFSVLLQEKVNSYLNGMLTSNEVISEMMALAKAMKEAHELGNELGLTVEELAFYDALTKPQAISDFYNHDQLIKLTKELTEALQRKKTLDWRNKESARAEMRSMIKRLLKKFDYPPDGYDEALSTVIEQCELWTDEVMEVI
ncbi:MAG: type I restriction endonuclease subunit R [Eubacteriales bacterium]